MKFNENETGIAFQSGVLPADLIKNNATLKDVEFTFTLSGKDHKEYSSSLELVKDKEQLKQLLSDTVSPKFDDAKGSYEKQQREEHLFATLKTAKYSNTKRTLKDPFKFLSKTRNKFTFVSSDDLHCHDSAIDINDLMYAFEDILLSFLDNKSDYWKKLIYSIHDED